MFTQEKKKNHVSTEDTNSPMFTEAVFIKAQTGNNPNVHQQENREKHCTIFKECYAEDKTNYEYIQHR